MDKRKARYFALLWEHVIAAPGAYACFAPERAGGMQLGVDFALKKARELKAEDFGNVPNIGDTPEIWHGEVEAAPEPEPAPTPAPEPAPTPAPAPAPDPAPGPAPGPAPTPAPNPLPNNAAKIVAECFVNVAFQLAEMSNEVKAEITVQKLDVVISGLIALRDSLK